MEATELVMALKYADSQKSRSQQIEIGPSEIGGCKRKTWLKLHNYPEVNNTLKFPAIFGTAIHKAIEQAIVLSDPFNAYELEVEVLDPDTGIKGHIDLYDSSRGMVVDWKTTKKASLRDFPSLAQRYQVHLYGYLLAKSGRPVTDVCLVAIPRDGTELDVKWFQEPYDSALALEAVEWYVDVTTRESMPEPEKPVKFCQGYCPYFGDGSCLGR